MGQKEETPPGTRRGTCWQPVRAQEIGRSGARRASLLAYPPFGRSTWRNKKSTDEASKEFRRRGRESSCPLNQVLAARRENTTGTAPAFSASSPLLRVSPFSPWYDSPKRRRHWCSLWACRNPHSPAFPVFLETNRRL